MKNRWFFLSAFFIQILCADQPPAPAKDIPEVHSMPWLTGPLIIPNGVVVPFGSFEVETYLYFISITGIYDQNWNSISIPNNFFTLNSQILFYFGLTSWMDISITPEFIYNHCLDQNEANFGDLMLSFDFQLLDPNRIPYFPGIKFTIQELFPTGSYQKLDPKKLLTDLTGRGTFATTFNFVLYKVYPLKPRNFLSTTYSMACTINTPVDVQGLNAYGGGVGTKGTVLPGNTLEGIVSFELTMNQNWVIALDNIFNYTGEAQFFGVDGITSFNVLNDIRLPSSTQISFAPAIEYNFSENLGIIGGAWITAWGKNAAQFRGFVISLAYNY
jgi:hypothetical protein